ncbi:dihydroorotate dehydrogenase (quinone) [Candidatus Microgenomates bacterium]|nr:dihydroorotate dehydrogenase (quinone) [Candidatus Microgenomates bacterium]
MGLLYRHFVKPLLFQFDAEKVHGFVVGVGELVGKVYRGRPIDNSNLRQTITGLNFPSPIGLAAGFDYQASLTQVLPLLGFGFGTVGTITNQPFAGNPAPRLGRLPKSRSLMVNKGFKNLGAAATIKKLAPLHFAIPVGVSLGTRRSLDDLVSAFKKFEHSTVDNAYYELNISCPNIAGGPNFYLPKNLEQLLVAIDKLDIKKPLFVKMPISQPNDAFLEMLTVISRHCPKGVIIGNLQKDRRHPSLDPAEVARFSVGYFSGKPTFDRSNELISLAYKYFAQKLVIIGCGGVFSAQDAYEKIKRGASLVQLITGLIFQGPQLPSEINQGLIDLLAKDGYTNIHEAIGSRYISTMTGRIRGRR